MRFPWRGAAAFAALLVAPIAVSAQGDAPRAINRADAVAQALAAGPRVAIALTDTAAASAGLTLARAFPNPVLAAGYSKATPQYHFSLDQPLEYPWLRSAREEAAAEFRRAAMYRFALERAFAELEADVAYTMTLAARAHARLSRHTAADADSLLVLARLRAEAGDASQLDVELAIVSAGEAANVSLSDSLAALDALLELQSLMGLPSDRPLIEPSDSLTEPALPAGTPAAGATLSVAAAEAAARSAERGVAVESNSIFNTPSIQVGFEQHDPSGAEPGTLPTIGISLPLPLWNQRGGEKAAARAGLARAQAALAFARRESDARVARARRELWAAALRVDRDRRLLASAQRVASMSLTAYAEGAAGLPTVLEAQRSARDAVARYLDDLAAEQTAAAYLRLHTLTATLP